MISRCERALALLDDGPSHPTLLAAAVILAQAKHDALSKAPARRGRPSAQGKPRRR